MATDRLFLSEVEIPAAQIGTGGVTNYTAILTEACLPNAWLDLDGGSAPQADGGDLIVTSDQAGTARLALDVITHTLNNDPTLSKVMLAVEPQTYSAAAVNKLYLWWGHAATQAQPAAAAAFGQHAAYHSSVKGFWPLESASLLDRTSFGNDGTIIGGAAATAGKVGNGITLDGVDSSVSMSNESVRSLSTMTVLLWVKPNTTTLQLIFENSTPGGFSDPAIERTLNLTPLFYVAGIGGATFGPLTQGVFYQLVGVIDGTRMKTYLDAAAVTDIAFTSSTKSNIGNMYLGSRDGTSLFHTGVVDHFSIWNTALGLADVETLHANLDDPGTFARGQVPSGRGVFPRPMMTLFRKRKRTKLGGVGVIPSGITIETQCFTKRDPGVNVDSRREIELTLVSAGSADYAFEETNVT